MLTASVIAWGGSNSKSASEPRLLDGKLLKAAFDMSFEAGRRTDLEDDVKAGFIGGVERKRWMDGGGDCSGAFEGCREL